MLYLARWFSTIEHVAVVQKRTSRSSGRFDWDCVIIDPMKTGRKIGEEVPLDNGELTALDEPVDILKDMVK